MVRPASPGSGILDGVRVVVTRASPGRLDDRLRSLGAAIVSVPTIMFVGAADGGMDLRAAARRLSEGDYEWLVVTSATAVAFLADADGLPVPAGTRIATIGPATVAEVGRPADLIPTRAVAEALVEAFPDGTGRVLLLRPEVTRDVVGPGLRSKGWQVDEVVAYRTVAAPVSEVARAAVADAHVVTFTSPSTVHGLISAVGAEGLPAIVVAIGPVTAAALADYGIEPAAIAESHGVDGIVDAIVRTCSEDPRP